MFWKRKLIKWVKSEVEDLRYWRDEVWKSRDGCEYQYNACDNSISTLLMILHILERNKTPYTDRHRIYKSE